MSVATYVQKKIVVSAKAKVQDRVRLEHKMFDRPFRKLCTVKHVYSDHPQDPKNVAVARRLLFYVLLN